MEAMRAQIEQLRQEASVTRKKVSECSNDLMEYCEKEKGKDMLLAGPGDHNPFQEKKSCSLL